MVHCVESVVVYTDMHSQSVTPKGCLDFSCVDGTVIKEFPFNFSVCSLQLGCTEYCIRSRKH